ncbi:MAG TPA: dihydrolipoamide acetyltransferase family protein [Oculatellaceae cyanobacterium]
MGTDFILPDLGEGIHEAEVLNVMVEEGATVQEDQPILEVETDKAVVEIPSPHAGTIAKVHVKQGQVVTVGSVMVSFTLEAPVAKVKGSRAAAASAGNAGGEQHKSEGRSEGKNGALPHSNGKAESLRQVPAEERELVHKDGPVPAAPATRRLARELGIDIRLVRGTGRHDRVLDADVKNFAATGGNAGISVAHGGNGAINGGSTAPAAKPKAEPTLAAKYGQGGEEKGGPADFGVLSAQPIDLPDFCKYGPTEIIPLKSLRRKIAINMAQSWSHIPHVTTFDEADVTEIDALRAKYEALVKSKGGRLTLTVLTIKAVVSALKKYPQFNASLNEKTSEIIFKHYYNIGIAVATERGLIVPVIKDADKKTIVELSAELSEIAEKTRAGKIELDRLQGGTFTITNIGAIGGTGAMPMINYPECAILAMARATQKPVVKNGNIEPALILPLSMSFDHRIADGAEAAYFVQHIVKMLQEPFTFILEA